MAVDIDETATKFLVALLTTDPNESAASIRELLAADLGELSDLEIIMTLVKSRETVELLRETVVWLTVGFTSELLAEEIK